MHKLLVRQIASARGADGTLDIDALLAAVQRTYEEIERDRRLNARAADLMEEELRAAMALARREATLLVDSVADALHDGLVITRKSGLVVSVNTAAMALFGGDRKAIVGRKLGTFVAEAERLLAEGGESLPVEALGRRCDGVMRALEVSVSRLMTDTDQRFLWIIRDVSQRKEREAQLEQAHAAARRQNEQKSAFLATMSHELRTPLNAILGFSEIIRDQLLGEAGARYAEYAGMIHASGTHLRSIIDDILDLSKIEAGAYVLDKAPRDPAPIVADCLAMLDPLAGKHAVEFLWNGAETPMLVALDERAFRQIVINIVSNAIKFTPPGGKVRVDLLASPSEATLVVTDTGVGIPPEQLPLLFRPYQQGNPHIARGEKGTGLGLTITEGLCKLHGGAIGITSEVGVGTCVRVILPRADEHSAASAA